MIQQKQGILIIFSFVALLCFSCNSKQQSVFSEMAVPVKLASNYAFTEGPAADMHGNVYFTDQPNNKIYRWNCSSNAVSVFMEHAGRANGLYFNNIGKLVACADLHSQLWAIDTTTQQYVLLLDSVGQYKLNGPNDLWIDKQNGMYFTDPFYRREYRQNKEQLHPSENVYYLPFRAEAPVVVDSTLKKPNGIIGTPDGKTLYVADIGDNKTYKYSINTDGTLHSRSLFCETGSDGMTIDTEGNVYLTGHGVHVFSASGDKIAHIAIDEPWTANVTFGGEQNNILFITASQSVYTLKMNVHGAF